MSLEAMITEGLPVEIRERLPHAQVHAERSMEKLTKALEKVFPKNSLDRKLQQIIQMQGTKEDKLKALYKIADAIGKEASQHSACRQGCSHCCHIPVAVTQTEANMLGKAIGRPALQILDAPSPSEDGYGYHRPCTFLVEDSCSVYQNRPLACRVHFNLDSDNLLCKLIQGVSVPLPLVNMGKLQFTYVYLHGGEKVADILRYFPRA